MSLIAETAVSGTSYSFDMLFSYAVPDKMSGTLKRGCRVLVRFGRGNRLRTGIVMRISTGDSNGLKPVIEQIDSEPVLSEELLELAEYVRENTFCTYFEAVKTMLPPGMSIIAKEHYSFCVRQPENIPEISAEAAELLENLRKAADDREFQKLTDEAGRQGKRHVLVELCSAKILETEDVFRQAVRGASVKMVRLTDKYLIQPESFQLTPKQKKTADFLSDCGQASVKELAYMCGVTESVIKRLAANGAAEIYDFEVMRGIGEYTGEHRNPESIRLSGEQQKAYDAVFSQIIRREPAVYLLHGVTGSGKTSVFEKLIYNTVQLHRQALLLIPEIGLTPQMLQRFRSLFGENVAVIHSGLSLGQRLDEFKRIRRGEANIVIGTRSAVFAPLDNIGLIIIDEEGERSYKSENAPRYSAVDAAKRRCAAHKAVLLLASATPSIESYYYAEKGVYKLLEMKSRYLDAPLPQVEIIDMDLERMDGNKAEFSRRLVEEINANLKSGEQTILLLNRRGYHTIVSCCNCSQPIYCPNCSVPLTYHKANGKMMCHYCGYISEPVMVCPVCGSEKFKKTGFGTQKLEEELAVFFPSARILRMDADTTFSRYSYEKNFDAFRKGEYDIMVGTQMIGKGLDFPNVTLVGVLSVDKALYAGDFRSYERTFSLITQVVGRSGRGSRNGRAILQTFMPDHYVMNLAAQQDYPAFYREEIAIRRAMIFPPVCDMCVFAFSGIDDDAVKKGAGAVLELMNLTLKELQPKTPVRVLGPVKCSYGRLNGKYRYRIIMKCKNNAEMRGFIRDILLKSAKLREMNKISLYADMNGDTGI